MVGTHIVVPSPAPVFFPASGRRPPPLPCRSGRLGPPSFGSLERRGTLSASVSVPFGFAGSGWPQGQPDNREQNKVRNFLLGPHKCTNRNLLETPAEKGDDTHASISVNNIDLP